jgi:hypothetical protein
LKESKGDEGEVSDKVQMTEKDGRSESCRELQRGRKGRVMM